MARTAVRILNAGLLMATASCSWSQFDDLEAQSSIVVLERPSQADGFGRSLVTATDGETTLVLASGTPGRSSAAAYSIGFDQAPAVDAAQVGYCSRENGNVAECLTTESPARFNVRNSRNDDDLCFAYAWGQSADASTPGVLARCFGDSADITLRVPSGARSARQRAFDLNRENQPLWLSNDSSGDWLLASLGNQNRAWYNVDNDTAGPPAVALDVPTESGASFGHRSAILDLGVANERLLVVAAPEEGEVWLYRATEDEAVLTGCLGVRPKFGRALATGDVDDDGVEDLVVSEESLVTVFSGSALAQLPQAFGETCSLAALPEGAIIASFGCGSRLALSGCNNSGFGASLAVGDVDADGDGEVLVGAPRMVVNGHDKAGAVLVYDAEGSEPHELSDVMYLSSAEQDDLLGTSVAAVPQGDKPDVIVAGGPGKSKVAVFFCSNLIDLEDREGRCAP